MSKSSFTHTYKEILVSLSVGWLIRISGAQQQRSENFSMVTDTTSYPQDREHSTFRNHDGIGVKSQWPAASHR
jgi:hypothetical protein